MPHKRALMAVLIVALTGAFLIPGAPAMAASLCHEWSFAAGANGWTGEYNTLWDNGGWNDSTQYDGAYIYITGLSPSDITGVEIDFNANWTGNSPRVYLGTQYPAGNWVDESSYTGGPTVAFEGLAIVGATTIYIVADRWVGNVQHYDSLRLTAIRVYCAGGAPEYESTPAAGGTVTIGAGQVSEQIVNSSAMQISNTGDDVLLNGFEITGDNAASFEMITDSPLGVTAGNSASVVIACTPPNFGATTATLTVTTNDADEATNTYTLSCTGDPPSGADAPNLGTCLAMGQAATFATGWTTLGGAGNPPGAQSGMMLPPGGEASYSLSLQPTWQYGMTVKYHSTDPAAGQTFKLRLGAHPGFDVPVIDDADLHTYEVPGGNYRPDQFGGYTLRLLGPASDTGLVVDYVCVSQRQIAGADPGQGGGGIGGVNAVCEDCWADPSVEGEGDIDFFQALLRAIGHIPNWLFCSIRQLFECELMPAVQGIWSMVTDTVKFLSSFRSLFDGIVTMVSDATVGNLGALGTFGGAHMANVGGMVGNAFYTSGLADAQNQIVGGVNNVAPSVANALGGLNGGGGAASSPTASGGPLGGPLGAIITAFGYLFTMVPQFIGSMIDGLNTSAYVPVSGSITCSNPGVILYYPCLGFYVADNTIFQGPAMYLIPILMAVLAWDTLTWAIAKFKEAFSR